MARIAVLGGSGSFGQAFVKRYHLEHDLTVISRDENKQHEMRLIFPDVNYVIGDVRDRGRMNEVLKGFDYIFHAAALKQVPSCEFNPTEAMKTNIMGTDHVLDASDGAKVVFLSTDKAVYPINAMGISKAMAEKIAISKGAVITRYGNVMRSRGSIIPIWEDQARQGKPLTITDPKMTRFLLSLDDSIDLVMFAMEHGDAGDIFVKKAPACTMFTLASAIGDNTKIIGTRHGEKTHETLISSEEMQRTEDMGGYYRVRADKRNMDYEHNSVENIETKPLASNNAVRLSVEQVKELICN